MTEVKHPERLEFLAELRRRQEPIYSQERMALFFRFSGTFAYQTVGKWESGQAIPSAKKYRERFLYYLWDELLLRRDRTQFAEKWQVLAEEWNWAALNETERGRFGLPPIDGKINAPLSVPFQAPIYTPYFVGRQREATDIAALLDQSPAQQNITALVGMGGIGKTALATHIAHSLKEQFPHGVLWARVATDNSLDILQSWAQAYGYDFSNISSVESRAAVVRDMLADKQVLMILDDVVNSADGRLLLPNASGCAVLITTRSADVAAALNTNHTVSIDGLTTQHGIDLLKKILGKDRVLQENESAYSICDILHNLPLAIEIAAQRLLSRPRLSLAAMVEQLEAHRLDLNINDRAVRSSFAVSWEDLDSPSQRIFSLLGVFEGRSFSTTTLAHVADLSETIIESYLADLVALSLAKEDEERYHQHPLLADFAAEKLAVQKNKLESDPYLRMAEFFFEFAQAHQMNFDTLGTELDNVMFGMGTAHRLDQWQLVLDYTEILTERWLICGEYSRAQQGYAWANQALAVLEDKRARIRYLCDWARSYFEQNNYGQSKKLLEEAESITHEVDEDMALSAKIAYWLGQVALEYGDHADAEQHLAHCERLYFTLEDDIGIALTKYQRAQLFYDRGDIDKSEALCQEAITLQQQNQQLELIASLRLLVDIAIEKDDLQRADKYCQQALQISETIHNQPEQAAVYYSLGVIRGLQDDIDSASEHIQNALALSQQLGLQDLIAINLYEQGKLQAKQNNFSSAIEHCCKSIAMFKNSGQKYNLIYGQKSLAEFYYQTGESEKGIRLLEDAFALAEEIEHPLVDEIRNTLAEWRTHSYGE